jgi:hypothetical protein
VFPHFDFRFKQPVFTTPVTNIVTLPQGCRNFGGLAFGRINFKRWRLIFVGLRCGTFFMYLLSFRKLRWLIFYYYYYYYYYIDERPS